MRVRGLSAISNMSYATSGISFTYLCARVAESTRTSMLLASARCFRANTFATASAFVASHPMPHTVSVG